MYDRKTDRSMSISAASLFAIVIVIPAVGLLAVLYSTVWGMEDFFDGFRDFFAWKSFIPSLLIGVPVHEGIHALTWMWLGKIPKEHIKFGVKQLTPYTHCEVPIPSRVYRVGAIMPAVIQGFLPYLIGLSTGQGWFTAFGLTFIFAAGGDYLILWILRGVKPDVMVEDHPSRVGCYVYE
jgi:hypothetical protein